MMHTPGPWIAKGGKVTNPTGSHFIADFGSLARGPAPEIEANAKLAAAAPDLKRELRAMVDLFRFALAHPGYGRDALTADEAKDRLDRAEAALRSAEG
jgi:hypothetical protein